ncbi:MAG: VWA domain-containing protein [Propionibacteriaceae bacterium]|nr:VWA domain-containing protein [Propionibacteriaceae bacterium]
MDSRLVRWRLVLGQGSERLGTLNARERAQSEALDFLYNREAQDGGAGSGDSTLTIPDWINEVHTLFPKRTVITIEEDALERYGLIEMVTNKALLERVEPSERLLQAILKTKHLMSADVLSAARHIVRRVISELLERMRPKIRRALSGRRDPNRRSLFKVAANFDPKRTIRANLKHYSAESRQLVISEPIFYSRTRRQSERWQFIVLVDQSGSMAESVIHAAVTASIFHGMPALKSHLIAFDTAVVDLTSEIDDPVETLMKVQLGGGTDIAQAMRYAESLITEPRKAMVVLITDLFEGGSEQHLVECVARMVQGSSRVLVLGALSESGAVNFDEALGRRLAGHGARVGVMTPNELAQWVAEAIR